MKQKEFYKEKYQGFIQFFSTLKPLISGIYLYFLYLSIQLKTSFIYLPANNNNVSKAI